MKHTTSLDSGVTRRNFIGLITAYVASVGGMSTSIVNPSDAITPEKLWTALGSAGKARARINAIARSLSEQARRQKYGLPASVSARFYLGSRHVDIAALDRSIISKLVECFESCQSMNNAVTACRKERPGAIIRNFLIEDFVGFRAGSDHAHLKASSQTVSDSLYDFFDTVNEIFQSSPILRNIAQDMNDGTSSVLDFGSFLPRLAKTIGLCPSDCLNTVPEFSVDHFAQLLQKLNQIQQEDPSLYKAMCGMNSRDFLGIDPPISDSVMAQTRSMVHALMNPIHYHDHYLQQEYQRLLEEQQRSREEYNNKNKSLNHLKATFDARLGFKFFSIQHTIAEIHTACREAEKLRNLL